MEKYLKVMKDAYVLLHLYRNNPEQVMNNARQVDPVIHDLRVSMSEIEAKQKGDTK